MSHNRCSRQAGKWRSVSPWAMAREVERLVADVGEVRLQLDAAEQAAQLARGELAECRGELHEVRRCRMTPG